MICSKEKVISWNELLTFLIKYLHVARINRISFKSNTRDKLVEALVLHWCFITQPLALLEVPLLLQSIHWWLVAGHGHWRRQPFETWCPWGTAVSSLLRLRIRCQACRGTRVTPSSGAWCRRRSLLALHTQHLGTWSRHGHCDAWWVTTTHRWRRRFGPLNWCSEILRRFSMLVIWGCLHWLIRFGCTNEIRKGSVIDHAALGVGPGTWELY